MLALMVASAQAAVARRPETSEDQNMFTPTTIDFWCSSCELHALLMIDASYTYLDADEREMHVKLGHCVKCSHPGIVESVELEPGEFGRQQLYPKALKKVAVELPRRVNESFREAIICEAAGAWLATAVMVRRTLEAIAKEFDSSVKTLVAGLDALRKNGLISDELHQWGTELRFIGNIGAHPTDDVITQQDARDAMDFLGAIVETIYTLRPKFQQMQQRRKKAKESAGGAGAPPVK